MGKNGLWNSIRLDLLSSRSINLTSFWVYFNVKFKVKFKTLKILLYLTVRFLQLKTIVKQFACKLFSNQVHSQHWFGIDNFEYFQLKQLATEQVMVTPTSSLAIESHVVLVQLSFKTKFKMRLLIRLYQLIDNSFDYFQLKHWTISSLAVPCLSVYTDCPHSRLPLAIVKKGVLKVETCWTCRISRSMVQSHHEINISKSYHKQEIDWFLSGDENAKCHQHWCSLNLHTSD